MKAFSALYRELDSSTSSLAKQAALQSYFRTAAPADAAWAVFFLAGGKPRQMVPNRLLKALAQEVAALPEWLFVESYEAVGDLAETIALLLPDPVDTQELSLAEWLSVHLLPLRGLPEEELRARLLAQWRTIAAADRLVYFKLITGSLRVGVSRLQVTQALAGVSGVDAKRMAQRLMGYTQIGSQPAAASFLTLIRPEDAQEQGPELAGHPYPFFLSHPFNQPPAHFDELLGSPADWLVEWKWDGIRAQLVKRGGQSWIWSRGEELVSEQFPELAQAGLSLPDGTVLDGEIVVWRDGRVRPFNELQKRLGRKILGSRILREQPVVLLAYDLLEEEGEDLRSQRQYVRRARLEALFEMHAPEASGLPLRLSPVVQGSTWEELAILREGARSQGTEGFMLKQRNAAYGVGRTKDVGRWWKWKIDAMSVDAVLVYAQRGHGRRASLYSDYTFAVWSDSPENPIRVLVPFAKAYSGLTDAEMAQVDAIIRKTTRESFGPVRSVEPTLLFELGFEGISRSSRHKSGIAVRFPRMLRWRQDKPVAEADTLQTLAALLPDGA